MPFAFQSPEIYLKRGREDFDPTLRLDRLLKRKAVGLGFTIFNDMTFVQSLNVNLEACDGITLIFRAGTLLQIGGSGL